MSAPTVDVEACVRLLTYFAAQEEARAEFMDEQARKILRLNTAYTVDRERENATEHRAQAAQLGALITFLRSALPGMGKDSERLDALESWTKGDQTICPPGNHGGEDKHWLLARDDDSKGDRYGIWSETTEGPTLRDAIDAAMSAPPSPERASPPINADDSRGHKSTSPCEKCGAMEVYVTQDSDDDADFTIHCYACGMHYRVDGPDA